MKLADEWMAAAGVQCHIKSVARSVTCAVCFPAVGFLQSGTKLLFRRKHREKESCLSQSHEDISNMGNNFTAAPSINRKKSGSFSRRLIKRFSFRSSGKSKGKSATNGGAGALDN